jgi:hypothetical protein
LYRYGLAERLERQARVRTPPIPVAAEGGVLTPAHSNHDLQQQQQQQPTSGSPTRKYARLGGVAPVGGAGMFS